ncbi:MAG: hypothetical protein K2H47_09025 [Muribaculaceae bacterium]|nr:hypothetical protein [Muribaculaceae bacterium]
MLNSSNFNRRCRDHDYRSRCIYMITMLKASGVPRFSTITRDERCKKISPVVKLSDVGIIIQNNLARLVTDYPELKVLARIIMPDHIHFELYVQQPTQLPLGSILAEFKSNCSTAFRCKTNTKCTSVQSLFTPGFNDKIAFREGAKDAFYNYISDNPRRYLIKKHCPEYFYHKLLIDVEGRLCGLYGNLFLLDHPLKAAVKISRRKEHTPDLAKKTGIWEEVLRAQGVLVSPFINPEEKKYYERAISTNTGIILIVNYTFSDRTKPYKKLFDLCAEGKLLIISTEQYLREQRITYPEAQYLNRIAAAVAQLAPQQARLRPR